MTTGDSTGSLSSRGHGMLAGGFASYIDAHVARQDDPGYVSLAIAENLQMFDLLGPRLESFPPVPPRVVGYDANAGRQVIREAIAGLVGRRMFGRAIDPAHVGVLSGASAVLEAMAFVLGDPGDGVLVPTPSYAGFWPDLGARAGLDVVGVPTRAGDGYQLTPDMLDRARADAGRPTPILLLTNPDNPRGQVRDRDEVEALIAWAEDRGVHVIADEVYGLTVFGEGTDFASVGRLRPSLGDHLHVVWAVSKDFGMSGLRCGAVVIENEPLRNAIELQGIWTGVSSLAQHAIAAMLADDAWVDTYLDAMRDRLGGLAATVSRALTAADVPHLPPTAGFFVLCDLREWLAEPTVEAEHALWQRILDEADVNLTPGSALRAPDPGIFRLCYAANPPEVVADAVTRVATVLQDIRRA